MKGRSIAGSVFRRRKAGLFAACGVAAWLAAVPASAQWFGGYGYAPPERPIPPHGIVRILSSRGFLEITPPRFAGDVYVVDAMNRFGERLRLTIDAYEGGVVARRRLAHGGPHPGPAPGPAYAGPPDTGPPIGAPAPDRYPVEADLVPPGSIPYGPDAGASVPARAVPPPAPPSAGVAPPPAPTKRARTPETPRTRQASRTEPGTRPAASRTAPPAGEAAQPHAAPAAPAPKVAAPTPAAQPAGTPAATASAPAAPMRVIGGVTPLNPDARTEAPRPAPPAETPPL